MRSRDEQGAVTAEAALVIPTVALVAVALAWLVCVAVAHVRALDAAREVARAVARGDSEAASVAVGRRVAGAGSRIRVVVQGDTVRVVVRSRVSGPGGLLGLGDHEVRAEAVALQEGS